MPWKVNNAMDARGRTLSVTPPGGGAITYEYAGNTVKIIEPGSLFTDYSYNGLGKLTTATMTRSGVTQTRTWTYDPATQRLLSVTLPETGTYDSQGLVRSKTDANLQFIDHILDIYNRLSKVRRSNPSGAEQTLQRTTFTYDLGFTAPDPVQTEFGRTAGGMVTSILNRNDVEIARALGISWSNGPAAAVNPFLRANCDQSRKY